MKRVMHAGLIALTAIGLLSTATQAAAQARHVLGVSCQTPPPLHCPAGNCPAELIRNPGNATDAKTGRSFFLDYPCNLRARDQVIFVLNLHGGGSIGNWQRHYFPIMDFKDKYKLVVATPSGTNGGWNPAMDDEHLHNIVNLVYEQFGRDRIKAFWLAGHSLGGQTSNRLVCTPFFRDKITGWVSLSGGRLGSRREDVRAPIPAAPAGSTPGRGAGGAGRGAAQTPPAAPRGGGPARGGLVADASILPDCEFSHIYSSGQHELTSAGLPANSPWAEHLKCGPRVRRKDIVDSKAGYVYDSREQANPNAVWGLKPRPGKAEFFLYPNCEDGRVVADIIRLDKGHTEGLEPKVTEEIIKLMVSAR